MLIFALDIATVIYIAFAVNETIRPGCELILLGVVIYSFFASSTIRYSANWQGCYQKDIAHEPGIGERTARRALTSANSAAT